MTPSEALPVQPDAVIVSCTKGIEQGTHKRMTEILQEYLPSNPIGVLSGPNHAEDICLGLPSASLIGFEDPKYFSRMFSEEFDVSPTEFRRLKQ